ncbi:hypothetical protein [Campylobacter iguaniorum]|uniref:hypothetical protein n=1 Tax=Campylobacter iguaniorum TaxID=1244531 RepID=UPI00073A4AF2|nr:hypothetical protein [Campylobacter iguaniorum]
MQSNKKSSSLVSLKKEKTLNSQIKFNNKFKLFFISSRGRFLADTTPYPLDNPRLLAVASVTKQNLPVKASKLLRLRAD